MLIASIAVPLFSVGLIMLSPGTVFGQDYPSKPVRIVTTEAGSNLDFAARVIAQGIAGPLKQTLIVDNRRNVVIAAEIVSRAPPDGYTLYFGADTLWLGPFMQTTPYDPVADFSPITLLSTSPNILVLHPSVPVNSVKELIALARARPGALNYASAATGGSPHLGVELFNTMAGINIVRIPYKGGGSAVIGIVGGQVQLMFAPVSLALPNVKSGKLRALAVTSARPSALLPELPTVAATLPGFESVSMQAMLAPARTPAAIIKRLNQEIVRLLGTAEVKGQLLNAGIEAVGSTPEEFAGIMKSEMAKWGKLIRDVGIKAD